MRPGITFTPSAAKRVARATRYVERTVLLGRLSYRRRGRGGGGLGGGPSAFRSYSNKATGIITVAGGVWSHGLLAPDTVSDADVSLSGGPDLYVYVERNLATGIVRINPVASSTYPTQEPNVIRKPLLLFRSENGVISFVEPLYAGGDIQTGGFFG